MIVQESEDLKETIARLNERLDEPLATVSTVTGAGAGRVPAPHEIKT